MKVWIKPIFWLIGPTIVRNDKVLNKVSGALLLSNHVSDIDAVLLQQSSPRHINFMAKSELFEMRGVGAVMKWWQAFPVIRDSADRKSLRYAIELLKEGHIVCVFPEGELSIDGKLQPFKAGVSLIAKAANVPIICVGIDGSQYMMPYAKVWPRPAFRKVYVTFSEPFSFESSEQVLERSRLEILELSNQKQVSL